MAKQQSEQSEQINVSIKPPSIVTLQYRIVGTAPLVINRFANKRVLIETQEQGSVNKKGKKRAPKDFQAAYQSARHISTDGWDGIHAGAFRCALISACRLVGFKMTVGKLSLFVLADGYAEDGTPLVRIQGKHEMATHTVRNTTGVVDVRARPMYKQWAVDLRIRFDSDQFTAQDVANLLLRVGMQVGIGEGRADSKMSCGMGWGSFDLAAESERMAAE
jgi:hypothetical protein